MRARVAAIVWVLLVPNAPATAQSLVDPTRPMDFTAAAASPGRVMEPHGPVLQSTVISPLRRSAVISGRSVKLGDSFDGATVVDIQPYEVRLRRGQRETTLRLMPKLAKELSTKEQVAKEQR